MIYLTNADKDKKVKKVLKSLGKSPKIVLKSPNERDIFRSLAKDPDTHIVIVMECTDTNAVARALAEYSRIDSDDLEKIIFDASDKKSLAKDLEKHSDEHVNLTVESVSDEIFEKIDKKIEKAKERCENTGILREKRGKLHDVIEGNADKSDTLKVHAKYRKLSKGIIKKINKIKDFNGIGVIK